MESFKSNSQVIVKGLTVAVAVVLQVITFVFLTLYVQAYFTWAYVALQSISFILIFALVNDQETYRQFWIIIVLVFPVTGLFLYFMWGRRRSNSRANVRFRSIEAKLQAYAPTKQDLLPRLQEKYPDKSQIARFLEGEGFCLYEKTEVKYFTLGEQMFEAMLEDLRQAKKCIFMEYFIINNGVIWDQIKEILIERAKEGVDIRLLIDDFGCLGINTPEFRRELSRAGIRLAVFAPIHKEVDRLSFNYRNHQKITIIDGNIGYCGGINISDEYANITKRFGHWKDTAIRMEGEGVWGLTSIFLGMWEMTIRYETNTDYTVYTPTVSAKTGGYVQSFADGPSSNPKNVAESVYTHLINKAREYIYITTPYLVLDRRMQEDLCRMARSGVDVRIVVPHIPDKWYVYMVNIANYGPLLASGVHIYEYTPGFVHSKTVVSDDECAICGTINTDYRSFFLHYECAVLMCDMPAVTDIRHDVEAMIEQSEEMVYAQWRRRPFINRIVQWVLKIFQPIM